MTTQQIERPLREVDETAERLQGRNRPDDPTEDRPSTEKRPAGAMRRASEILERVTQDPGLLFRAVVLAVGLVSAVVVLAVAISSGRRPPRTAEEVLLERSREAFDRGRETLETIAARLSSLDR